MAITRRQFLASSAALSLAASASFDLLATPKPGAIDTGAAIIPRASSNRSANIILGGGEYKLAADTPSRYVLSIIDMDAGQRELAPMTFLPHGIHRKPTRPQCLAIFEKKGPGACEFDLELGKIIRTIKPLANRYFYGHGAYTVDGGVLLSTETYLDTLRGVIAIRDGKTMAALGEFPSYGLEPHECKLIDGGKTLVVSNGGGTLTGEAANIAYIDIASQQLLEKVPLANHRFNAGHLVVSGNGSLLVVSAPRAGLGSSHVGGVSMRSPQQPLTTAASPAAIADNLYGEALSAAIHPQSGIAAVTHPDANLISFWSMAERKFIRAIELYRPRGLTLSADGRYFLVTAGREVSLQRIAVDTLQLDAKSVMQHSYISGSHIYNWSAAMTEILAPGPLI